MNKIINSEKTAFKDLLDYCQNQENKDARCEFLIRFLTMGFLIPEIIRYRIDHLFYQIDNLEYSEELRFHLIFKYVYLNTVKGIDTTSYNSDQVLILLLIYTKYPEVFEKKKKLLLNKENINFAIMSSQELTTQAKALLYLVNNPKIIPEVRHFENLP